MFQSVSFKYMAIWQKIRPGGGALWATIRRRRILHSKSLLLSWCHDHISHERCYTFFSLSVCMPCMFLCTVSVALVKKCTQVFLALLVFQVHTAWADTIGERDSPMKQTFTNCWSSIISILRYQKEISSGCSLLLVVWIHFYYFPSNFATQTPYSTVFLKLVSQACIALVKLFSRNSEMTSCESVRAHSLWFLFEKAINN